MDEIGPWTEIKLKAFDDYIRGFHYKMVTGKGQYFQRKEYIDGFSSTGINKTEKDITINGSPLISLAYDCFTKYHFIEKDNEKMIELKQNVGEISKTVQFYLDDCNKVIQEKIVPSLQNAKKTRALFLLDPYGAHIKWETVEMIGKLGFADLIINFPISDILRNIENPLDEERIKKCIGFDDFKSIGYAKQPGLFDFELLEKNPKSGQIILEEYVKLLKEKAGFKNVTSKPLPLKNRKNAIMFYVLIATHNDKANKLAESTIKRRIKEVDDVTKQNTVDKRNMESDNRLFKD